MSDEPKLFDDTVDLLAAPDEAGAEYVVVGAHVLAAHGVPRATGDFDILVRPSLEKAKRVTAALTTFGASLEAHGVTAADFARRACVTFLSR